ncbi:MAG TPA: polyprenyl synthetase family protein [Patescibacteria group bacterium]|nr:polyprenyl synthetase family protein [Patescibacteria group bacterium]
MSDSSDSSDSADLFGPVARDLVAVETALRLEIEADPPVVAPPMADLFAAGGKRIRPALVLLSARFGDCEPDRLAAAAMAVELTHAATLVHDDVIDRSAVRRGRPTVAARLGDEPAIVIGDFYFAKAYELASRTASPHVVSILAHAVMDVCAGEVHQQAVRYRYSTGVDEYMRRIEAKTATLLAACCDIGALLGGLGDLQRDALREYGRLLGLAFQIADDVLDFVGTEGEIGKPIGHDIAEGFSTLPLMLARQDGAVAARLDKILLDGRKLGAAAAREVCALVRDSHGPRLALAQARDHAQAARDQLNNLLAGEPSSTLAAIAAYVVSRKL